MKVEVSVGGNHHNGEVAYKMGDKVWPECIGDTHEKIAATLAQLGVKGKRCSASTCPVAMSYYKYVPNLSDKVKVIGVTHIDLGGAITIRSLVEVNNIYHQVALQNRLAIGQFILRFDNGEYPELEKKEIASEQKEEEREEG